MSQATCSFAGCGRPVHGHGYCSAHYGQLRRRVALRPVPAEPDPLVCVCAALDDDGLECRTCHRPVPTAEFLASAAAGAARLAAGLGS